MDNKEARMTLAERARACENWRWMPGMLVEGNRVLSVAYISSPYDYAYASYMGGPVFLLALDRVLPDLSDAATLGCVIALYDATRKMLTCPDPVYTAISVYGLADIQTVTALVEALEKP